MPREVRTYRVFISARSDVRAERDVLESVIRDVGAKLSKHYSISLKPVRWEKDGWPFMGEIQDELFKQLGDYDVFVGIFWTRYGTPSGNYDSGSKAEFMDAYERWSADKKRPILMYFCERPAEVDLLNTPPEKLIEHAEQTKKLQAFRKELEGKGLYWTYREIDEFKELTSSHLYNALVELMEGRATDAVHVDEKQNQDIRSVLPEDRIRYLKALRRDCLQIPLTVLGEEANFRKAVTLDQVFVSLQVTQKSQEDLKESDHWMRQEDGEPVAALEAVQDCEQVVLLGDPGSGKSSFVKHVLANLAQCEVEDIEPIIPNTKGLLPVLIILRDLAPTLAAGDIPQEHDSRRLTLANLIVGQAMVNTHILQVPEFSEGIRRAFVDEKVFLVLDGLDEVPYDLRSLVREAVGAVLNQFNLPRVIVTCRVRSYSGASVFDGVKTYTLAGLNEELITSFIERWYRAQCDLDRVKEVDRPLRVDDLSTVATREPLLSLAQNPMLLTTMTIIHQQETVLPKERVKLYEKAVDLLLKRWQKGKGILPESLRTLLDSRDEKMRPIMERLAFEAHKAGVDDAAADLGRLETIGLLAEAPYLGNEALASQFLDYVDLRSGLLIGRGGTPQRPTVYSFPHRTFQEYLAGCYTIGARGAARRLGDLAAEGDFWSEAVLLGIEEQVYNSGSYGQNHILNLVAQLTRQDPGSEAESRVVLWMGKAAEVVGADTVAQDPGDVEPGLKVLKRLRNQLVELLSGSLPAIERAEAGRTLARLGDPRSEIMTIEGMPFCYVPAGPFLVGDDVKEESVPYDYWISQYPITQAQYQAFVDAGGYEESRWWTKEGWEFKEKQSWARQREIGGAFDLPNHPVVGVSAFEAEAFASWLTDLGRERGWLGPEEAIVLPGNNEWEKAARGGLEIPDDAMVKSIVDIPSHMQLSIKHNPIPDREYPWGKEATKEHANSRDSSIGSTATPGCFSTGISPYGIHDISGNVPEWLRIKLGSGRMVRGGGWHDSLEFIRSADIDTFPGESRDSVVGFRIVVSSIVDQKNINENNKLLTYDIELTLSNKEISVGSDLEAIVTLGPKGSGSNKAGMLGILNVEHTGNELNFILRATGFAYLNNHFASLPLDGEEVETKGISTSLQSALFHLTALRPGIYEISVDVYLGSILKKTLSCEVRVKGINESWLLKQSAKLQSRPVPQPHLLLEVRTVWNEERSQFVYQYALECIHEPKRKSFGTMFRSQELPAGWLSQSKELLKTSLLDTSKGLVEDVYSRLSGVGQYLYNKLIPNDLDEVLQATISPGFSLLVIADQDGWVPWELLHDGKTFLCERLVIGRWFRELIDQLPYEFPIGQVSVSYYMGVEQPETWATLLFPSSQPQFKAIPIPGGVLSLEQTEAIRGLHLIQQGHSSGVSDQRNAPVLIEGSGNDFARDLKDAKLNLRRNRPLVSLSYLSNGQPEMTTLEQTWTSAFLRAGCSAFVGPLWATSHDVEAAFMSTFYRRLWEGDALGEAFIKARYLARSAVPDSLDWLAYVLFGDPMARPYLAIDGEGYAVVEPIGYSIEDPLKPGDVARFRVSLRRKPPVWHTGRVVEVAEELTFQELKVHVITGGLNQELLHVEMKRIPNGDYLGWFSLNVPQNASDDVATVHIYFVDGVRPLHSIRFTIQIISSGRR